MRAVPYVVPRIVDAVAGRPKELVGVSAVGGAIEADEKFLGAVLGTLAQVIPHVAPVIIDAVTGRRWVWVQKRSRVSSNLPRVA